MPKPSPHALIWSDEQQSYELFTLRIFQRSFRQEDESAWLAWVDEQSTFAFQGQAGHLSVIKEARSKGASYWYAYRRQARHTRKRYLGQSAALSLARLEETAFSLMQQSTSPEHFSATARHQESIFSAGPAFQRTEPARNSLPQYLLSADMSTPLLATKLRPPRLPALLVERAHLLTLLDAGQKQKLTLLQAPAGCGKTTLITQWITLHRAQATRVAWISLDEGDNDPLRFWSSVIAACQAFGRGIGQTTQEQFSPLTFKQNPLEAGLTLLINDLADITGEGVLVLEEYQWIVYTRIHESIIFFIEHLPANIHVIILTRSEPPLPLVRWRARGELQEIYSLQLRFFLEETGTFLRQTLPPPISEETVRLLQTSLEGWVAGLRLLALSWQNQVKPPAIEDALAQLKAGSTADRAYRPIQEFFLSEVFSAQPEPLQLFLLQTSVLSRFTSSLCDAVTRREDSAMWLELLQRSGFFLEALDSTGEWYRYPPLFAETMRAEARRRLGDETLRELAAAASRWYEEHSLLIEAIEAALSAQKFEQAAHLIKKLNERAYFAEYHTTHFTVHTIERRGRGLSGPQGADYSITKECEDVLALQQKTGASLLVGHSYGGLVALEVARNNRTITRIAVYEPGVSIDGSISTDWMPGYERKLTEKKDMDAFIEFIRSTGPEVTRKAPSWYMKCLMPFILSPHERKTIFSLLHESLREHKEAARLNNSYENYRYISASILYMYGGKNHTPLADRQVNQLTAVFAHSETKEFPQLEHFGINKNASREVATVVNAYFLR